MAELLQRLTTAPAGGYAIERELGGGRSRVFLAEELALGRTVVVKVIGPVRAREFSRKRSQIGHDIFSSHYFARLRLRKGRSLFRADWPPESGLDILIQSP